MAYVDIGGGSGGGTGGGLIPFAPSLLVAVTNIVPSGARSIDGRTTADLERVLLTAQTDPIQNGIWLTDLGVWQRPPDLPVGSNAAFAFTFIQEGDTYANTGWSNGSVPSSIVGTDPQQWFQVIAPGQLIARDGLLLTGSTLDVVPDLDGSLVATPGNLKVGTLATDLQHGDRGGGTLHMDATPAVAGFLSAADKTKLDGLSPGGSVPPTRLVATGDGLTGGGDLSVDRTHSVVPHPDASIEVSVDGVRVGVLANDAMHGSRGGGTLHDIADPLDNGFMSSAEHLKLITIEDGATNTPLSLALPALLFPGFTGTIGTSPAAARSDHAHGTPSGVPVSVTKAANAEGVAALFARSDHKHDVATAVPVTVGLANAEGAATSLARSDHVHAHGAQTDQTLHALATTGANGFLSAADKSKLDTVAQNAAPAMLAWGNTAVSGTTTVRYLSPYYGTVLATTSPTQFRVSRNGTLRNMRVRQNDALGNGQPIVYTLRVNGVPTTLTVSVASNVVDGSNTVATVAVLAGDLLDIEVTKVASVGTSPSEVITTIGFGS